jgi:hypothetical protein
MRRFMCCAPSLNSRCQTAQCCSFPQRLAAPGFCLPLVAPASPRLRRHSPSPNFGAQASRPLSSSATTDSRTPDEGWMERRQAHSLLSVARARRDTRAVRRGPPRDDRDPLSALHRGDFRPRTHAAGSRQWNRSRSDCPRQTLMPGGRGPDLPMPRFAPQRGTPLLAPSFRIVSRKRPL